MLNIVLFGPPGAGKGTQSEYLTETFGLKHLSTGDIFRHNIKENTELGVLAKSYMDKGHLVPDEVTISILETEVVQHSGAKGFIFDGFPRTEAQAVALDNFLSTKGTSISLMLALEVAEEELVKRLLSRGQTSGRTDDQDETIIRNRIIEYNTKTAPLKEFYSKQNKFRSIHGIGSIEEISQRLSEAIHSIT